MITGLELIEKEICIQIKDHLDKVGILYRMFSRSKDLLSIEEKIDRKEKENDPYISGGKLMQDIIGIRIVTYFKDDVDLVYSILRPRFNFLNEQIDTPELTVFKPKRTNLIFRFNKSHSDIFKEVREISYNSYFDLIDNTFELQLRTMLSEGWHEIDHSLRYKCKDDWYNHVEDERMLNGIYATLETNDIVLKSLFNELAHKHYKSANWEGLLRNKFRLKFQHGSLDTTLIDVLNRNPGLGKKIFRLERMEILNKISSLEFSIPITFNNILYLINAFYLKNDELNKLTPKVIIDELS